MIFNSCKGIFNPFKNQILFFIQGIKLYLPVLRLLLLLFKTALKGKVKI
jgi:hypothetical protein